MQRFLSELNKLHTYLVTFSKSEAYAFVEDVLRQESGNTRDGPSAAQTAAFITTVLNQWRHKRGASDVIVDDTEK